MDTHSLQTYITKADLSADDYVSILDYVGRLRKTIILKMDKKNSYGVYTVFLPNAIVTSNDLQNAMQRSLSMFLNHSYSEPPKLANMKTNSITKTSGRNLVKYLDQHYLSSEDTMKIFRCVGEYDDVIGYKMDGERSQSKYTIVIAFHDAPMDTIRADAETLQEGVQSVLKEYCALKNIV